MSMLRRQRPTPVSRARDSVVETIESARSRVDARLDEAEREVERIAGRVDRRYRFLRDRAQELRSEASERAEGAGRRLREGYRAARGRAAELRRELTARLEAHPVGWPVAAGALGFLAGMALGRRGRASAAR